MWPTAADRVAVGWAWTARPDESGEDTLVNRHSAGVLETVVSTPETSVESAGLRPLGWGGRRDGLLFVPERPDPASPAPLLVALHGAGGEAAQMTAPRRTGRPRVFVSHGVHDRVLPIDRCRRRLVSALISAGYDVDFHEFDGAHVVPADMVSRSLDRFLS
jgi:predicted esterase